MNGHGQPDRPVVPASPPNKAMAGEERGRAKGNTASKPRPGRSAGSGVSSALDRVRQVAVRDREARFTALLHHVNVDQLRASTAVAITRFVGRSVWVGFVQGLTGQAGGDHAGEVGHVAMSSCGQCSAWVMASFAVWALAIWSSRLASLRWASPRQPSTACVRDASSALDSRSENPTSRSNRITPTSPAADSG
jgi:hypothetical protein